MPTANINGVQLNYVQLDESEHPAREDLVMVHGLATNMAFWYFRYGLALAKRFRVTLYDLRGHGRSEMPATGYSPTVLAQDLAGLLDHLNIEKAHFMAHSFGGVVTLNFACEQPHRVRSLVLADSHFSAGRRGQARDEWVFGRKVQDVLDRQGERLSANDPYFGPKLLTRVAQWQLHGQEVPAALVEMVSPLLGKTGRRASADWLKLMNTTSAEAEMLSDDGLALDGRGRNAERRRAGARAAAAAALSHHCDVR
jgi:pimeloyl-ACP methyl ester carboxylesterase